MVCTIKNPFGQTASYADIAHQIGKPKAVRAVGGAVGRNPISIIVPCHRILGKQQQLTGFGIAGKTLLVATRKHRFCR